MTTQDEVRRTLNEIVDPCSVAAGAPAGLIDMGLVRDVRVEAGPGGARVTVTISVSEPSCLMGGPFAGQARDRLEALDGVAEISVHIDPAMDWTPASMTEEYRERLREVRSRRRLPIVELPTARAGR